MEAALEQSEAAREQSNAENSNLKSAWQTVNAEIEALRAEQKKRNEKEREIAPVQLEILRSLPSEYGGRWLKMFEIARAASVRVDEAEVYVAGLEKLGLIIFQHHEPGGGGWRRTAEGNSLVVAKRWAGEEEAEEIKPKRSKHGELSKSEEIVLLKLAGTDEGVMPSEVAETIQGTAPMALFILICLRDKNMAADSDAPTYETERRWFILRNGLEHLAERGLI